MKQYVGLDVSHAETAVLDTATTRPDHWSGWTQVPISDSDVRRIPTFITSPMTPPSCTRSPSVYHKRRELVCRPNLVVAKPPHVATHCGFRKSTPSGGSVSEIE
jgi:hypothetical protein